MAQSSQYNSSGRCVSCGASYSENHNTSCLYAIQHVEGCRLWVDGSCTCDLITLEPTKVPELDSIKQAVQDRAQAGQPLVSFASGTTSSKIPRFDLIPYKAQLRLAKRFEVGLETHKEKSWNARSKQDALTDEEFIIARASHVIHHAMKLIAKRTGQLPPDEDDDAAAIAWGGIFLCEATEPKTTITDQGVPRYLTGTGHWRECTYKDGECTCAKLTDKYQGKIDESVAHASEVYKK